MRIDKEYVLQLAWVLALRARNEEGSVDGLLEESELKAYLERCDEDEG